MTLWDMPSTTNLFNIFSPFTVPVNIFAGFLNTLLLEVIKSAKSTIYRQRRCINGKDDEAEAEGEGKLGMLMVGNVIVNRRKANCLDFEGLRTIPQVIFQVQGGNYSFEAVQKGNVFYNRARSVGKRLAKQTLDYWRASFQVCSMVF
ncbi:hypothetical protein NCCP133_37470 [Cytobacillus sp. NCCP-133]|nr:hypothetical protein NCCP133_37470 [Cytobacillus sp. NCCP-133]